MHSSHLPGDDPERVDVAGLRNFGANNSEALRVDQFRGCAMEEPIDVYPRQVGWNRGCSKAGNTDMSTSVYEDVRLGGRERVAKTEIKQGSYDLEVSMDDVGAVHITHSARYFQQLMSRYQSNDRG